MTEQEYNRGNRIALTYFMQAFAVALMLSAAYFGYRAVTEGRSPAFLAVLLGINFGLFLFQAHIRRSLIARG